MEPENKIALPALGALLAAVVGGVLWAVIAISTDYEIGLIAWAIGGLAATAVIRLNQGPTTRLHQFIAVFASLLGIFLGKYFIFAYIINDGMEGMFASGLLSIFLQNIREFFGGMDIIFVLMAVVTAWQMPGRLIQKNSPDNQQYPL